MLITSLVAFKKLLLCNFRGKIKCIFINRGISIISGVFLNFMALFFEDVAWFIYSLSPFLIIKKLEYDRMIL
jgi:hypothetical protein